MLVKPTIHHGMSIPFLQIWWNYITWCVISFLEKSACSTSQPHSNMLSHNKLFIYT